MLRFAGISLQLRLVALWLTVLIYGPHAFCEEPLRVLTLNAFLLDLNSTSKKTAVERARVIPYQVAKLNPDVMIFQEVWGSYYRDTLINEFEKLGYPDHAYQASVPVLTSGDSVVGGILVVSGITGAAGLKIRPTSVPRKITRRSFLVGSAGTLALDVYAGKLDLDLRNYGNGLLIISRHPISPEAESMYFKASTRPEEYFVYKGIMRVSVQVPNIGWVDFYATHAGARQYDPQLGDYEPADNQNNLEQLRELVRWIDTVGSRRRGMYSGLYFLAGDFNRNYETFKNGKWSGQLDPAYKLLTDGAGTLGLTDTYRAVHGFTQPPAYTDGPVTILGAQQKGPTGVPVGDVSTYPGEVNDYIFVNDANKARPVESRVVLKENLSLLACAAALQQISGSKVPLDFQVSDHFGVMTTFQLIK